MPQALGFQLGKLLVILGIVAAGAGIALMAGSRPHLPGFGHLPGDITWRGKSGSFYFPIATCLIASAALTLMLWAVSLLLKR